MQALSNEKGNEKKWKQGMKSGTKSLFGCYDSTFRGYKKNSDLRISVCRHVFPCESGHAIWIGGEAIKFWMKNI